MLGECEALMKHSFCAIQVFEATYCPTHSLAGVWHRVPNSMRDTESRGDLEMRLCEAGYGQLDFIQPTALVTRCIIYGQG